MWNQVAAETGIEVNADIEGIFREASPVLWRTIYAFTGGRGDLADDAVAEAFARALEHWTQIRDPIPWLYRVAFRVARVEMKQQAKNSPMADAAVDPIPEGLRDLMQALRQLSPNQRAAIVLHYEADKPVNEVADLIGISSAAVRVHLYRGRRRLQAILAGGSEADV